MIICLDDCFTAITLDMLYLITFFYERSFFIKPIVCNLASGTRYLVCKGFRPYRNLELLQNSLSQLYSDIHTHLTIQPELPIHRFLHQHIPYMFYSKIEEINSILNQPRLEFMHQRINYHESEIEKRSRTKTSTITSTSLDHPRKTTIFEIKKCIDWCNRFQMPVQNGIKLMHILRDYENEIPVIIMTACHDIDIFERAVDAGADAFIKKPFDVEEIRDLTKSLISVEKRNNSIKESFDSLSCSY